MKSNSGGNPGLWPVSPLEPLWPFRKSQIIVNKMSAKCPQNVHKMSAKCPQNVRKMSTKCPRNVYKMSTKCK